MPANRIRERFFGHTGTCRRYSIICWRNGG
jgi:hypothetical protein